MAGFGPDNGAQRSSQTKIMAEINVTPMVDVMLVLLIIFMVAAPLLVAGVPVELPKIPPAHQPAEQARHRDARRRPQPLYTG